MGIGEYDVDDVIFNIPFVQEIGWPREMPSVIGKLVTLGIPPIQTLFVYARIDEPISIPNLKPSEGAFCNSLEYFSLSMLIQWYFLRC